MVNPYEPSQVTESNPEAVLPQRVSGLFRWRIIPAALMLLYAVFGPFAAVGVCLIGYFRWKKEIPTSTEQWMLFVVGVIGASALAPVDWLAARNWMRGRWKLAICLTIFVVPLVSLTGFAMENLTSKHVQ